MIAGGGRFGVGGSYRGVFRCGTGLGFFETLFAFEFAENEFPFRDNPFDCNSYLTEGICCRFGFFSWILMHGSIHRIIIHSYWYRSKIISVEQ